MGPLLKTGFKWKLWPATQASEVTDRIAHASLVLSNKVPITATHMASAKSLRFISVLATGTNNIDLVAAEQLGIAVSNVRNYSTQAVVQHTLNLIFALASNLLSYHKDVQDKKWQDSSHFCYFNRGIMELQGKTLTILGFGNQGQKLAHIAQEMGMKVQIAARPGSAGKQSPDRKTLHELLPYTDVLSFHCPLSPETENILNHENIFRLKKGALVINCARGGLINETALAQALACEHLGGAALDVATTEPPALDHPLMKIKHPNFILTPHIAWASLESRQRLLNETLENIQAFLNGQPRNLVLGSLR